MKENIDLSVIIPVGDRIDNLAELHRSYRSGLDDCGLSVELIYVLDGPNDAAISQLHSLREKGETFEILQLGKRFGEATALMAGISNSGGRKLLTLPAYFQIKSSELRKMLAAAEGVDMVIGRRWPRRGSRLQDWRRSGFHWLLKLVTGENFRDLGCSVRVLDRRVMEDINLYGDQHRLFPVLATQQGFRVLEIDVAQSDQDKFLGKYRAREYLHRILDIFTVFFLVRFTKKPLRFFGMIGSMIFGVGAIVITVLILQRLFLDQSLADRPALLLSSLLLVLGVQFFAFGLLGELIIFTHAGELKEYRIAEVIESGVSSQSVSEIQVGEKSHRDPHARDNARAR